MPSKLYGKWKLTKNEKFDEYMKQIGVNFAMRKAGLVVSSTTEITDEGNNQVRINTQSTFKSANVLFPLGQEIDEHTMDGRNCKTTVVWEGDTKLVEMQKWDEGKREAKLEWIYEDEKMILDSVFRLLKVKNKLSVDPAVSYAYCELASTNERGWKAMVLFVSGFTKDAPKKYRTTSMSSNQRDEYSTIFTR